MKKVLAVSALALSSVLANIALGQYTVTMSTAFEGEYIFRGQRLAEQTVMPSIELGYENFYTGIWAALPAVGGISDNRGNEFDFYGGYGVQVSEMLSLDFGGTIFYYPELADPDADEFTYEPYIGASLDMEYVDPSLYLYYDFETEAFTAEVSGGHSFAVPMDQPVSLDVSAFLGFVEPDQADEYFYYGASADVVYSVTDSSTISAGLRVSLNTEDDLEGVDGDFFWGGVSFTTQF